MLKLDKDTDTLFFIKSSIKIKPIEFMRIEEKIQIIDKDTLKAQLIIVFVVSSMKKGKKIEKIKNC